MKMGYFPGCSLQGTAREFDESLKALAPLLDLELAEVPDWNCCGATAAHCIDKELAVALPARILALAEKAGMDEVLVPCSACYGRLVHARHAVQSDDLARRRLSEHLGLEVRGTARPVNVLELLVDHTDRLAGLVKEPFAFPVASYYGCLMVRPSKVVRFDRPEDPRSMDEVMKAVGAEAVDWAFKTECCGAGLSVARTDVVGRLSGRILDDAVGRGAEVIVTACPMCHSNLDMRRAAIEKETGRRYDLPILYVTQAVGLALGLDEGALGLRRHFVPVRLPSRRALPEAAAAAAKPEQAAKAAAKPARAAAGTKEA